MDIGSICGEKACCILIGAGECSQTSVDRKKEDLCIAVDGGFRHCKALGITPDLILGDMDSVDEKSRAEMMEMKKKEPDRVVTLNPKKDDTDMLAAIRVGLERGYRFFCMYGAMGGRIEHTLANIQCLGFLKNNGAEGYLLDEGVMMTLIRDESIRLHPNGKQYFSLFSVGERAEGVTVRGMKYPLCRAVVTDDYPIGISNEFTGEAAEISVEKGRLLLVVTRM